MIGNCAVLLRALFLDVTGKPCVVISEAGQGAAQYGNVSALPSAAMKVEITQDARDEDMAGSIRRAYDEWKKSAALDSGSLVLPSCIALCAHNAIQAVYWRASDIDAARKRCAQKDAAPETVRRDAGGAVIDAAQRAAVVQNRIALVTGGAQGIGEEIVRNLAAAGALVFIADLNRDGSDALAQKINAELGKTSALAIQVNVADEASVQAMCATVAETAGGLDLCVSNAGVLKAGSVLEQELADFKFVTDINYTAFFVISKYVGRLLRCQHINAPQWKTDIVQVNSKSGLEGSNKNSAYAGGKFGGLGLVQSFALELIEYNIKVNAICPGNFFDGPLWSDPDRGLFVQYLRTGKVPGAQTIADVRAFYEAKVPMKRGCTGKDLARALFYIVEQEYETGQAVPVTGGQVMLK